MGLTYFLALQEALPARLVGWGGESPGYDVPIYDNGCDGGSVDVTHP